MMRMMDCPIRGKERRKDSGRQPAKNRGANTVYATKVLEPNTTFSLPNPSAQVKLFLPMTIF